MKATQWLGGDGTEVEDVQILASRRDVPYLLELGDDFAFIGRQRRLRLDNVRYTVDAVFFHRNLRALLLLDLKIGAFTHADADQMNLYLLSRDRNNK